MTRERQNAFVAPGAGYQSATDESRKLLYSVPESTDSPCSSDGVPRRLSGTSNSLGLPEATHAHQPKSL
eukprot:SAG31_NODE_2044_length_6580_cov_2.757445_5_plen_69_part_00